MWKVRRETPVSNFPAMAAISVISESTIFQAGNYINDNSSENLELNPWDLQFLLLETVQKGLLFHYPTSSSSSPEHTHTLIHHLKCSLFSTLDFFPPLAGRLVVTHHDGDDTASVFIACNNAGVSFVHAVAENIKIVDILEPTYVPPFVHSFFPLSKAKNMEATSNPLLAVQVTELVDGIFIACSMNHCLVDGTSYWQFLNSWAEISRNGSNHKLSKPLRSKDGFFKPQLLPERIFHFTREKIAEIKAKANSEASTNKISSLQAVLSHVWRSVIRAQNLDPQEEVTYEILVSGRSRITDPPIPHNFGIALHFVSIPMKAGDLLSNGGLGRFALEMNKVIALHTDEKFKRDFECWVRDPKLFTLNDKNIGKALGTSSSPRFNFYGGNDFGWGRPVAVRSGSGNKQRGKLTVYGGAEEGSMDIELCISYEILEAMGRDPEFMDAVSIYNSHQ